jgi:hypothetical protein
MVIGKDANTAVSCRVAAPANISYAVGDVAMTQMMALA